MELGIKLENGEHRAITYKKPIFRKRIGVSVEPIVIAKSLEEGLADLVKSAQEEEQEAAWLYVHDNSRWYNLASEYYEENTKDGCIAGIAQGYTPLYLEGKRKTHYHTHSKQFCDKATAVALKELHAIHPEQDKISMAIIGGFLKNCDYLDSIFPSSKDIENYIHAASIHKEGSMDFGIVSAEFITQIQIESVPASANAKIKQSYKEMYEILHCAIKESFLENVPLQRLAEEHCRRLNEGIQGLSIKIREHQ